MNLHRQLHRALRLLVPLVAFLSGLASAQDLKLYFLDVGQGDAVLVTTPDGKSLAYDAGRARDRAAQLIRARGVTRLDLAVMSQGDADHIGGFEGIAEQLRPLNVLSNGLAATTQTYARVIAAFRAAGTVGLRAEERTIRLGSSVTLRVLPAPPGVPAGDQNANSVGLLLEFGGFKAFLGGDAEPVTMRGWAAKYSAQLANIDVFKATHHGSKNNDTREFLELLRPQDVGIGVGANNPYGHPNAEALALYAGVGAAVWRTDRHGTVTVTVKPDGRYTVRTEKLNLGASRVARAAKLAMPSPQPPQPPQPTPPPPQPQPPQPQPPQPPTPQPPQPTPPALVGTLGFLGRVYYVYDKPLPAPVPPAISPNLVGLVAAQGGTLYIYDGPASGTPSLPPAPPAPSPAPAPPAPPPPTPPGGVGSAPPLADGSCPATHPIKGNEGASGKVYHLPGGALYAATRAEVCFAMAGDAEGAGFRPSGR